MKKPKASAGVRIFKEPVVKLIRMGREVMVYSGEFGKLDLGSERIELLKASVSVNEMSFTSDRITIDLHGNQLTAEGPVAIEEAGVHIESDGLTAQPTLTGLKLKGKVRLRADNLEAADALLKSGKL